MLDGVLKRCPQLMHRVRPIRDVHRDDHGPEEIDWVERVGESREIPEVRSGGVPPLLGVQVRHVIGEAGRRGVRRPRDRYVHVVLGIASAQCEPTGSALHGIVHHVLGYVCYLTVAVDLRTSLTEHVENQRASDQNPEFPQTSDALSVYELLFVPRQKLQLCTSHPIPFCTGATSTA